MHIQIEPLGEKVVSHPELSIFAALQKQDSNIIVAICGLSNGGQIFNLDT